MQSFLEFPLQWKLRMILRLQDDSKVPFHRNLRIIPFYKGKNHLIWICLPLPLLTPTFKCRWELVVGWHQGSQTLNKVEEKGGGWLIAMSNWAPYRDPLGLPRPHSRFPSKFSLDFSRLSSLAFHLGCCPSGLGLLSSLFKSSALCILHCLLAW